MKNTSNYYNQVLIQCKDLKDFLLIQDIQNLANTVTSIYELSE